MRQRFFGLLIVLMTSSLAGIICLQGYLIVDAYKGNERHFNFNVKQALRASSYKIQSQEFLRHFHAIKKASNQIDKKEEILQNICTYEKNNEDVYSQELNTKVKSALDSVATSVAKDTSFNCVKIQRYTTHELYTTADYEYSFFQSLISEFTQKLEIPKRVNNYQVKFHLNNQLLKNNVNVPYEFAVYQGGIITSIKSENFRYSGKNIFKTNLFENSDGASNSILVVNFVGKKAFVIKSIILMIILSVILSLVIMGTFFYAYILLKRQRDVSQIKTDFINNMTHELKTPIATINLALDFIRNPKVINDEVMRENYLNMIDQENKRIHAQVESVLRISRLEKSGINTPKTRENLNTLLDKAINQLAPQIEESQAIINLDLKAVRCHVLANQSSFVTALVNILDNSLKYSKKTPNINIYSENVKNSIILKVEDNGVGIRRNAKKNIFENFFRESTGNVHNVKGCGLGLAYVKQILDDHQGQISVESKKGKGTQITIELPLIS